MYGITADTGFEYRLSATFTSILELFSGKEQLLFQYKGVISRKKREIPGANKPFQGKGLSSVVAWLSIILNIAMENFL